MLKGGSTAETYSLGSRNSLFLSLSPEYVYKSSMDHICAVQEVATTHTWLN